MKLRIKILKYHLWYFCQISLQIMLLPIQIIQQKKFQSQLVIGRSFPKINKQMYNFFFFFMVGHLFQNYDTIYVRFFATYSCDLSYFPKYVTIFFSNAHIYAHNKSPYMCVTNKYVYIWGHRESSYKSHRIIPSAKNPFMCDRAEK